jgi:hypothetical protein
MKLSTAACLGGWRPAVLGRANRQEAWRLSLEDVLSQGHAWGGVGMVRPEL